MGGPELGWRHPAGQDQEEMGAGTLILRTVGAAGSEAGGEQRKEVCVQPPPRLSGSKAPPLGTCSLVLQTHLGRIHLSKGSRLIPYWLQS